MMRSAKLSPAHEQMLLRLARQVLEQAVAVDPPRWEAPHGHGLPEELRQPGASFVTLLYHGQLRGCMGSLEAEEPLAISVMRGAFNAAFRDPRFAPLRAQELSGLQVKVSVLTSPEAITMGSRRELCQVLRPAQDGLLLHYHERRATFLPDVWLSIPDPIEFVARLLTKGGIPDSAEPPELRAFRYQTQTFAEAPAQ